MRTSKEQEDWRYDFRQANASLALEGVVMDARDLADQEKVITGEWTMEDYFAESLRLAREMEAKKPPSQDSQ